MAGSKTKTRANKLTVPKKVNDFKKPQILLTKPYHNHQPICFFYF